MSECQPDIRQALDGAAQVLHDRDEVDLVELRDMLAANLAARPTVAELVREAAALGGTPLDEAELYQAIAVWIVDLQLEDGLVWRPGTPVRRRPRRR